MDIHLRRVSANDAAAMSEMMNDPHVFPGLMQLPFSSPEMWRERLEKSSKSVNDLSLVAEVGGKIVGSAGLHESSPSPRRAHARGLGMSVAAAYQGKGVGTALMNGLLDWADNWTHVTRIELNVYADNEAAIRLYKKFGFVQEGLFRNYAMRAGVLTDTLAMARFKPGGSP
jgi:L-phenylalanine/L-methionine N-acetyltransferase